MRPTTLSAFPDGLPVSAHALQVVGCRAQFVEDEEEEGLWANSMAAALTLEPRHTSSQDLKHHIVKYGAFMASVMSSLR